MIKRRPALLFIFLTVLIDMIGIGIIIPVIPRLLTEITGEGMDQAVVYGMWLLTAYALMQFLFAPLLGELSDRYGRRPILLVALFVFSLDYLVHAYAPSFSYLLIARVVAGISGSTHSVAAAYVADISTAEDKAKNFGILGAAFGLGFIIGPGIGGIFGDMDIRLPFFVAAGFTFLNFLFGLFFVPESLPESERRSFDWSKVAPGVSLLALRRYQGIGLLVAAFFLANIAGQALPATWSYFTIERFDWSEAQIGYSLMAVGILVSLVQGLLIGRAVARFGERMTVIGGFTLWCIGMSLFSIVSTPFMLYCFLIPYALGGVAGPTLQSIVSNKVPDNEQGNLQGALTGLMSLTAIGGPLMASTVFSYFIGSEAPFYFPGAPYALSGIILLLATVLAVLGFKSKQGSAVSVD